MLCHVEWSTLQWSQRTQSKLGQSLAHAIWRYAGTIVCHSNENITVLSRAIHCFILLRFTLTTQGGIITSSNAFAFFLLKITLE